MEMPTGRSESEAAEAITAYLNQTIQPDTEPNQQAQQSAPEQRKPAPAQQDPKPPAQRAAAPEPTPEPTQPTEEQPAEEQEGEPEEVAIDSLEAIASYFQVEPTEVLSNIEVEAPDGTKVPIGVALEQWRDAEALVSHRRSELEAEHAKRMQDADLAEQRQLAQLHAATKGMVATLNEEYSDEKIARIRREDPERYVEMIDRKRALLGQIERAVEFFEDHSRRAQAQSEQDIQKLLASENEKLIKARPEWADRKVRSQALVAGQKLLRDMGWSQQEIDSVMDHRVLLLVDLAVKGKRATQVPAQKSVEELRKRGLKRPTVGLNGQPRRDTEGPNQMKARAQARAVLKKSGDVRDAARLIEDLL